MARRLVEVGVKIPAMVVTFVELAHHCVEPLLPKLCLIIHYGYIRDTDIKYGAGPLVPLVPFFQSISCIARISNSLKKWDHGDQGTRTHRSLSRKIKYIHGLAQFFQTISYSCYTGDTLRKLRQLRQCASLLTTLITRLNK